VCPQIVDSPPAELKALADEVEKWSMQVRA
jgi:hypothetical protein